MTSAGPGDAPTSAPGPPRGGFGLPTATFVVVASMIGVGILTTSGYTVNAVGSNSLMLALWIVGGLAALCGALTQAELSAAMPRTGGDYVFLYEAYGPLVAFLSGWVSFLLGFGGPIAATASASAKYLLAPAGLPGDEARLAERAVATVAILALAAIHSAGAGPSARVQGTITTLKIAFLTALAAAGVVAGWGSWENLADWPVLDGPRLSASAFSLVYIMYAYTGWNSASYLAGEVEDPGRVLPRAILLGTGLVVGLYLGLNLFYTLALSVADIRQVGEGSLAEIAELAAVRVFGPKLAAPLSMAAGATLLASLGALTLTGPRVALAMARAGQFPAVAGRVSARTGAPVVATMLQVGWSLVLLWTGSFERIMVFSSVGLAAFSMLAIGSVFLLRLRRPDLERPFRTPGYPVTPLIYLAATAALLAAVAADEEKRWVTALALVSILAGIPVYYLGPGRSTSRISKSSSPP